MFGYICPNRWELKLKDISRYSGCYCALCDQLSRDYGFLGRFILSYDVTFLFLCLNALTPGSREVRRIRCPYYIWQVKRPAVAPEALQYAAFINYWLVVQKLLDDARDDRVPWKAWARRLLTAKRQYRAMQAKYRPQAETLSAALGRVYEQEQALHTERDFDAATNAFGAFFAALFQMPRPEGADGQAEVLLQRLAFQLGKWIYIMDAFDDYERDRRRNACNLLAALNGGTAPEKADAFDMALTLHLQIKHKIGSLLRGAAGPLEDACIRNIATHGIDAVFYRIVRKRYREFAERVEQLGDFSVEQLAGKGQ